LSGNVGSYGLKHKKNKISVNACSHVAGHKYAGNVVYIQSKSNYGTLVSSLARIVVLPNFEEF